MASPNTWRAKPAAPIGLDPWKPREWSLAGQLWWGLCPGGSALSHRAGLSSTATPGSFLGCYLPKLKGNTWWWPPADSSNHKCTLRLCFGQTLLWVVYFYYFLITLIEGGIFPYISAIRPLYLLPPAAPVGSVPANTTVSHISVLGWSLLRPPPPLILLENREQMNFINSLSL